ncbi:MAG: acyltransferase [Bacteroidales bacterium]|nr:acyltransferase [Bacteroidales bacterium]
MKIVETIKSSPRLKRITLRFLMPKNQARPRKWVIWFVNPFYHHKGKHSLIRKSTRMDLLPFNNFHLGDDSTVEDFTVINNGVGDIYIGDRTRIGIGCTLIGPVSVGNDVGVAQGVVMTALNHNYEDISKPTSKQGVSTAPIIIEDEVWLGANCVILPGITVGKHSVIAAGSVVTKNIPPYSVAFGNPARVIRQYKPDAKAWQP